MTPPIYTLQLQRDGRLVHQSIPYVNAASALRHFSRLLPQCRHDGMVVALQDGQEITPQALQDIANATNWSRRHDTR